MERDKGIPISYLMDRSIINIAKSQIGFLDVIIVPAYQAANKVINLDYNIQNLNENKLNWQNKFDEYEERMNREIESLNNKQSIKTTFK